MSNSEVLFSPLMGCPEMSTLFPGILDYDFKKLLQNMVTSFRFCVCIHSPYSRINLIIITNLKQAPTSNLKQTPPTFSLHTPMKFSVINCTSVTELWNMAPAISLSSPKGDEFHIHPTNCRLCVYIYLSLQPHCWIKFPLEQKTVFPLSLIS